MHAVPRFGRSEKTFDPSRQVAQVEFVAPDGRTSTRPTFAHQPAVFDYDEHGYETVRAAGDVVDAVRFTPDTSGTWRYRALRDGATVEEGEFACEPSAHPGYIEVSPEDPRYFRCSDGAPYCAIGLNLCIAPAFPTRQRSRAADRDRWATLGAREYARWFRRLAENGGNFARLWLGQGYLQVETEVAGEHDLLRFAALDRVVELARETGVRLKLCIENFRCFDPKGSQPRTLRHPADGRAPTGMDEWFQDETWQGLWMKKVRALTARYGDDPTIMAWELWNEINCCRTGDWAVQREWTRKMLPRLKALAPRNLVTNSIGSFARDEYLAKWYMDFHMPELDFQQVHRYLDQGAEIEVVRIDPVAFSIDAVQRTRRPDRPVLLAETGGVNDGHSGPFRYYRWDDRGMILHDVTYPAFFAGAAGSGHIWHWAEYVDQKNLWHAYKPLADALAGVALDREAFVPVDLSGDTFWFLALRGKTCLLAWVRNKADSWHAVLRDGIEPATVRGARVDLRPLGFPDGRAEVFSQWSEPSAPMELRDGRLELPEFRYGFLLRLRR